MDAYRKAVESLTPELYRRLRQAVETGRWPDGGSVSKDQRAHALQAVIAWETLHLPVEQRSGFIERTGCGSDADAAQPITLLEPKP